jgi:hypothetical protein
MSYRSHVLTAYLHTADVAGMSGSMAVPNFAGQKHLKFRGLARIEFGGLRFDSERALSTQNIKRLQRIYKLEGCQRQDDRNFVDALIDNEQFEEISRQQPLAFQTVPPQAWSAAPIVNNVKLRCLTGQHRIKAADGYLDANDRWWIARLYSSGS